MKNALHKAQNWLFIFQQAFSYSHKWWCVCVCVGLSQKYLQCVCSRLFKQMFNPKPDVSVRRAVSWRRATSVTLSTWAVTSTSRVPSSTPPLCWATRAGWPDTRWPSTRPSPNWPRTTSPSDTEPETSSCTPTCEYSTDFWTGGQRTQMFNRKHKNILSSFMASTAGLSVDEPLWIFSLSGTTAPSSAAPSTRRWTMSWRRRSLWPGPPAVTTLASASLPNTSWTKTPLCL